MDVTPLIRRGQQVIQGYASGTFKINNILYPHAVIVLPGAVVDWGVGAAHTLEALEFAYFQPIIDLSGQVDVFLLGCGASGGILDVYLRRRLNEFGVRIESMDTGAACRTYNVLMAEGRRVAAALLPVRA